MKLSCPIGTFRVSIRAIFALALFTLIATNASAVTYFGPSPYLSASNIPVGFYASGSPAALENFEDGTLDFGISASGGGTSPPALPTRTDSVDADDGLIDGSGSDGTSWFIDDLGGFAELIFTFTGPLPTAAGLVWTDGAQQHDIFFEAFGPGMISLGQIGPFSFADAQNTGQTGEDRFFGALDAQGILAIRISNTNAAGGIEVDHIQYGTMIPLPGALGLFGTALGLLGWLRRKRQ